MHSTIDIKDWWRIIYDIRSIVSIGNERYSKYTNTDIFFDGCCDCADIHDAENNSFMSSRDFLPWMFASNRGLPHLPRLVLSTSHRLESIGAYPPLEASGQAGNLQWHLSPEQPSRNQCTLRRHQIWHRLVLNCIWTLNHKLLRLGLVSQHTTCKRVLSTSRISDMQLLSTYIIVLFFFIFLASGGPIPGAEQQAKQHSQTPTLPVKHRYRKTEVRSSWIDLNRRS